MREAVTHRTAKPVKGLVRSSGELDGADFLERVEQRLAQMGSRGALAYIEIQNPYGFPTNNKNPVGATHALMHEEFSDQISNFLNRDELFTWKDGYFIVLLSGMGTARRKLRELARRIATRTCPLNNRGVHLTPAIGYVDLQKCISVSDLCEKAELALTCAKASLELEPFCYDPAAHRSEPRANKWNLLTLWNRCPQWLVLSVQFMISSIIGLGAPFFLYAACDALGVDISGPVYIGVVAVLVITATMIWVEGLLAIRESPLPKDVGAPFPPATIIIPAYLPNEAGTILETLEAFLRLDYPNTVQIIIAYNSPIPHMPIETYLRELAAARSGDRFTIEPIRVLSSTSKAQNVNAVIGNVHGAFVGIFDADHHPRPDSLERAWRWLSNGWDIVQGRCSIRNGSDSWVARMISVEFEQIYSVSHPGRARLHGFGIFGGSNGFWRTPVLHQTRMRHSMLTEDIDSSIRAVREGYRIASDRHLVSEELAPTSLDQLLNQRLRWAQGWLQVSLKRIVPALFSTKVSLRQKLGLLHLLVWRELFPWYSIQVVPILLYWMWAYGWHYIQWAVPIFVLTTIYTFSTGPFQILLAYILSRKGKSHKGAWFVEYLFVSMFFYSPFKDTISRIAHIKEAMRERAWRVTPRATASKKPTGARAAASIATVVAVLLLGSIRSGFADDGAPRPVSSREYLATLLGGEVSTINAARHAAKESHYSESAKLFQKAIVAVPSRRGELLREYADALNYANRGAEAARLYREMLQSPTLTAEGRLEIKNRLALALTWSSQFRAALAIYDELLAQSPQSADFAIHRARVLASLGEIKQAGAALDRVPARQWSSGSLAEIGQETLTIAARDAARTDQNELSAQLFNRAIQHDSRQRTSLLREYADQLLFTGQQDEAVPLYKAVLDDRSYSADARRAASLGLAQALLQLGKPIEATKYFTETLKAAPIDSQDYKTAQRGLSLGLTWSGAPAKALSAWREYLKSTPRDADAMVHQAQVLSMLHQPEEAIQVFRAAYAIDHKNVAARRGIIDETVNLARAAARNDKNKDSAALFASAIEVDRNKRKELLREYADQLSFSHRAGEAVPLYREYLDGAKLSALEKKRAMRGLADASAWSDQPEEALDTYTELVAAYPDDATLRWTRLVFAARQAAQQDRNKDSASLFAQALEVKTVPSLTILREYADQLSFIGRLDSATSLYLEFLKNPQLSVLDKVTAKKGLAQAYDWAGNQAAAKDIYQQLIREFPDDISYQWSLVVTSAHEAARLDRNKEAAILFAKAIRLLPARREILLKDYADQLSFTGQAARAIPYYREVLVQPALPESDKLLAQKSLAQAYDWSGQPGSAKALYSSMRKQYPNDVGLQWGILVSSGHEAGMQDRNKEAADFLSQAIHLMPVRRMTVLKDYADKLTFSDRPRDAIPLYQELIAKGGERKALRAAKFALALALSWDKQSEAAIEQYQELVTLDPEDLEARNGLARTLSWADRQAEAEAAYRETLNRSPKNPEAQRGLAQVEDWQGHHQAAQLLLAERLADDPKDLDARRLLAQSLSWAGRPDAAMRELRLALQQERENNVGQSGGLDARSPSALDRLNAMQHGPPKNGMRPINDMFER